MPPNHQAAPRDTEADLQGAEPAAASAPLRIGYHTPADYAAQTWTSPAQPTVQPLAAIIHGDFAAPVRPWPQIASHLRPLSGAPCLEVILAAGPVAYGRDPEQEFAATPELLFAATRLEETAELGMEAMTELAYTRLRRLMLARGYPYLLRTWNILQDINREQDGLERYRQFCLGRHAGFVQYQEDRGTRHPAASAIGAPSGGLCVYALAAKSPGLPLENPRQVNPFWYPAQYGPRSPDFSRGLVKSWDRGRNLFLSGTASITGHESRHPGSLAQQMETTLDNLASLIGAAERAVGRPFPAGPATAALKAYVRNSEDYPQVRASVEDRFGPELGVVYLQADICRTELLCEVDGTVFLDAP